MVATKIAGVSVALQMPRGEDTERRGVVAIRASTGERNIGGTAIGRHASNGRAERAALEAKPGAVPTTVVATTERWGCGGAMEIPSVVKRQLQQKWRLLATPGSYSLL